MKGEGRGDVAPTRSAVAKALERQYRAALAMHRDAVERCPTRLWADGTHLNAFWQIAYHALFITHLYLQTHADAYEPWPGHQADVQHEDGLTGDVDPGSSAPAGPRPYSKDEVLSYSSFCEDRLGGWIEALELASSESGFYWYPIPKLEHQLVNLRHLQHHTAQLADRLRNEAGEGAAWVGSRNQDAG